MDCTAFIDRSKNIKIESTATPVDLEDIEHFQDLANQLPLVGFSKREGAMPSFFFGLLFFCEFYLYAGTAS